MQAILLLADAAQEAGNGKVSALGLGWSVTGTPTPACSLVLLIKVPWDQTNRRHTTRLTLVDADGQAPAVGEPTIEGEFEVGRPPGIPAGTPIDQQLVVNVGPGLNLRAGTTYQWRVEINGDEVASASFFVRA